MVPAINPVHYGLKAFRLRPEIVSDLLAALDRDHYGLAVPALTPSLLPTEAAPPLDTLVPNRAIFSSYLIAQNISHLASSAWWLLPYTKTITSLDPLVDALIYIGLVYAPT